MTNKKIVSSPKYLIIPPELTASFNQLNSSEPGPKTQSFDLLPENPKVALFTNLTISIRTIDLMLLDVKSITPEQALQSVEIIYKTLSELSQEDRNVVLTFTRRQQVTDLLNKLDQPKVTYDEEGEEIIIPSPIDVRTEVLQIRLRALLTLLT